MSAALGRSQASSRRSAKHGGIPMSAAPGRPQASSHRSAKHGGIPMSAAPGRPKQARAAVRSTEVFP
jgi:hypothetical protein